ncbi:MAG: 50S ribosomal protein L20 [Candidatus Taylorbacteria bacterium RIFCSPLOWO2_12_FULL_47_20]|uniref:Large ribosomal subunit protein bL20 n=2 Tax=Candidatus Tayloriibacteriota TaxID=1817919 RepID=A0A1G2P4E3_9BACT|nr:MAG: 50S ribosomal protein L20 [Candidatus Taylorbacteria bacterium RIFCSPLOWO2_02_FULL_46_40]OHA43196.1 MAG: 50S ribosomal protein L20 [Candidatus Taylorbacteria bacterium RIFCSPLOWO2_12_FULL_47_20]
MTRVKKGVNALKTRRNILKQVKGFRYGRSTKERQAYEALAHAGAYSFAHRRDKKNDFRQAWNVAINAATRGNGTTYSKLIGSFKKKNIGLNRKMLAQIAVESPETFKNIVDLSLA